MFFKIIAACLLVAYCQGHPAYHHATSYQEHNQHSGLHHWVPSHYAHGGHHHDYYAYPDYRFSYAVHDGHTGDIKSQHEVRHGDQVSGGYQLVEPDGRTRKVVYHADGHSGFNANVHHSGPLHHIH